uniref:Putative multidrug resistance protein n=1 Tax=Tanacetum cinerariifolium TaxID=118510 RepID=A0A6L2JP14_TANCI|nr:putative multidrug resistance protein [Tanacetum cinerariifolium]
MMKDSKIGIQEKKPKLFNEWERFTSTDEESIENQNGLIVVLGIANQNLNGNGNIVATRAEGNTNRNNGNQIRFYNFRGLGHLARNCTVRPRRRDVAYLQTQLLIAQKEEAGIQIQAKESDLMAAAIDLYEIKEVNANCILMANLQQVSTSGTQTDKAPVYDSDRSAKSGRIIAIPCTKKSAGLRVNDIDLFEINKALKSESSRCLATLLHEIKNCGNDNRFEKDEGLSWIAMMDTSAFNMSYQAWERDQPEGTTLVDQMEKNDGSSRKPDSRAPSVLLKMITEHVDRIDMILMALRSEGCVANGLSLSLVMLVLSRMTNGYASLSYITTSDINQVSIRKTRKALDDCRMATYLDPGFLKVCLIAGKLHGRLLLLFDNYLLHHVET